MFCVLFHTNCMLPSLLPLHGPSGLRGYLSLCSASLVDPITSLEANLEHILYFYLKASFWFYWGRKAKPCQPFSGSQLACSPFRALPLLYLFLLTLLLVLLGCCFFFFLVCILCFLL